MRQWLYAVKSTRNLHLKPISANRSGMILSTNFSLATEAKTVAFGAMLGQTLARHDVITLAGPLGAGKTTLARALIQAASGEAEVPSPTFGLLQTYQATDFTIYHFDLYRIEDKNEVWELGFEEALEDGATLIEWPERAAAHIPRQALHIRLSGTGKARHAYLSFDASWSRRIETLGMPGQ